MNGAWLERLNMRSVSIVAITCLLLAGCSSAVDLTEKDPAERLLDERLQHYLNESTDPGGVSRKRSSGGLVRPPEFLAYQKVVRERLRASLAERLPRELASTDLKADVFFRISRDGTVSGVELRQGSGNVTFDEVAVSVVHKLSPLPPPPEAVYLFFRDGFLSKIRTNE